MSKNKKNRFHCKTEAQKKAIQISYAVKTKQENFTKSKKEFPDKFPFWARLKISKKRTTLVIDEEKIVDKKTKKLEDAYVHREATHTEKSDYEKIEPNPDPTDKAPMYLKRPSKLPKRMFELHNKNLNMPEHLKKKYDKNNYKDK